MNWSTGRLTTIDSEMTGTQPVLGLGRWFPGASLSADGRNLPVVRLHNQSGIWMLGSQ